MKFSLYQRLAFALFALFMVISVVFFLYWQHIDKQNRQEAEQRLHLSLAANLARDNPLLQQGVYDHPALKNLFHTLMVLGPAFEFYYLDPQGKILTYSADSSLIKRQHIDLLPIRTLIENKAALPIYGDDPKQAHRQNVFSAAPVFNGNNLQGYLYVIVAGERYQTAFNNVNLNNHIEATWLYIIAAFIFLFVAMLWLFRFITKPVQQLTQQIQTFKKSGFDPRVLPNVNPKKHNEVAQLACVFKEMAEQIQQQFNVLNDMDDKRKALLTEISHDLRTPLASLTGYIETIALKEEQLSSTEQKRYINTALKSACQLNTLIDQIFELAHLESGHANVDLENFNLIELLYDIIAKFKFSAEQAKVTLRIACDGDMLYVNSDLAKVERVLTNLIENAIRHTPAQGEIVLQVTEVLEDTLPGKVNTQYQVSVQDNGSGIKTEELAYIFDHRYRASNATQGKHAGLGLTIAKRLTELLASDLKVSSQFGQGTCFKFSLPKS